MIHGCVTLDEVFAAAAVRAASLVPETSGYMALAVGDATLRKPFAIDDRTVMLTTEGNVGITRRSAESLPPKAAAQSLRDVLARLLAVSTGTAMPALAAAGRPREESDRGVDAVVEEIEAALIPVNRAAARRALARLARETIKAKESGKVLKRTASSASLSEPLVAEAPPEQHVVVEATTPPPPPPAPPPPDPEPTPTVLGMAAVEVEVEPEPEPRETVELMAELPVVEVTIEEPPPAPVDGTPTRELQRAPVEQPAACEPCAATPVGGFWVDEVANAQPEVSSDAPTAQPAAVATAALDEPDVLRQPSEEPELAFEHAAASRRPIVEPITPPFALDATPSPRAMPATCTRTAQPSRMPTRADELLARFGASCVDDDMREAAACLRRMAGIEVTPPPAAVRAPNTLIRTRRVGSSSLGLTLAVLLLGVAGGGALVRLRPDLFGPGHPSHEEPARAELPVKSF